MGLINARVRLPVKESCCRLCCASTRVAKDLQRHCAAGSIWCRLTGQQLVTASGTGRALQTWTSSDVHLWHAVQYLSRRHQAIHIYISLPEPTNHDPCPRGLGMLRDSTSQDSHIIAASLANHMLVIIPANCLQPVHAGIQGADSLHQVRLPRQCVTPCADQQTGRRPGSGAERTTAQMPCATSSACMAR